jgi:UPF0755 protein
MTRLARPILIVTVLLTAVFYLSRLLSPVASVPIQPIEFVIEKGQSLDQITGNLKDHNLVRSSSAAKLMILSQGISKDIQAGYFYLSPTSNLSKIVLSLTKASSKQVWVTIPEGLRRQEIALITERALNQSGSGKNFSAQDFVLATSRLEGHIFPETYALNPNSSTEEVIDIFTTQFGKAINNLSIPKDQIESTIILASLVEREAGSSEEMLEIAGIMKKRLQADWPLQIDATIQFIKANETCSRLDCDYWANNISKNDLKISSPYNTYKNLGLPPGPIANPGQEAIKASFEAKSSDYWFYLHDLKGQIHFAKTIEGHNQNICEYLNKDCN